MTRLIIFMVSMGLLASCRSSKKLQTAIAKRDTATHAKVTPVIRNTEDLRKNDTLQMIRNTLHGIDSNRIDYKTFSAKVDVDFTGGDGKKYNLNCFARIRKDSAIWLMARVSLLNIEVVRILITKDSIKVMKKQEKTYTMRSVDYLQDVASLPLDLKTMQDLIVGNPVFLDSNIIAYSAGNNMISMLSLGEYFKNLITLSASDKILMHSKLDDADVTRNRTADLTYSDYESKKGFPFSTRRRITIAEQTKLDIKMDFKQYEFNGEVDFPFTIPKKFTRE